MDRRASADLYSKHGDCARGGLVREADVSVRSIEMSRKAATRWVLVLTGIGSLMAALGTLVVSTALSTIRLDLGASVEQLEWTVNAYNLSFAVTNHGRGDR
jgi:hypothetical protein